LAILAHVTRTDRLTYKKTNRPPSRTTL